jgi:hypothetical protein
LCDYGLPPFAFEKNALSEQELQQFIEAMKAERIKNTSTPEQAEQFLIELGFLDENGELSEKYAKSAA